MGLFCAKESSISDLQTRLMQKMNNNHYNAAKDIVNIESRLRRSIPAYERAYREDVQEISQKMFGMQKRKRKRSKRKSRRRR